MKRVFIAVDIDEQIRRTVSDYIEDLRRKFPDVRVGWEKPEKLHLTLKFLGRTEEDVLGKLSERICDTVSSREPFEINIAGTGAFPSARSPRVIWIGVADAEEKFSAMAKTVEEICRGFGFEAESRKFHPHLTIARIKDPHGVRELGEFHLDQKLGSIPLAVKNVTIYESKLAPTGSRYYKLAEYPLGSRR